MKKQPTVEARSNQALRNTPENSRYTFSGKERDGETGYSYFGARYYNSDISIWLSVDPLSDKYPNLTPYAYCANNPIILVDPDGKEYGDFFDWSGKYLGADGKKDENVFFVGDRKSIKKIRDNDKSGGTTNANDVKVDVSTTKSVLKEILDIDLRTTNNGETREEATMLTTDKGRYTGQGPDITTLGWDATPDVIVDVVGNIDVGIHSHLANIRKNPNGSGEIKFSSALRPSASDRTVKANLNVITGSLGDPTWISTSQGAGGCWSIPTKGAAFYDSNWNFKGSMKMKAIRRILNQ